MHQKHILIEHITFMDIAIVQSERISLFNNTSIFVFFFLLMSGSCIAIQYVQKSKI